jgi:lipoyl(octanoyl) transferase
MLIRHLGIVDYTPVYQAMQDFTRARVPETEDELWICQHHAVFTQGIAGKAEHLMMPSSIPVVQTDRGGQITFHGIGQIVVYLMINLHRLNIFVKEYVYRIEEAILSTLSFYGVTGHRILSAPGIYVFLDDPFNHAVLAKRSINNHTEIDFSGLGKIAALGIKVSKGCTYHGVALNVAMDLSPFKAINPCGYAALTTVDMASLGVSVAIEEVMYQLTQRLLARFKPINA